MWNKLIAFAVTIPMTITIASAQAAQDADIAAYSQDLAMRIARGQQSGQLSVANYNRVQGLYNNVEMIRRGIGNKPMNPMIRMNMMNSLTNLDKQLTGYLRDDVNARYQMWDPNRKSWRNNWWQADNSGANNFNSEIDAYQNSLKARIDRGRSSGRITRNELNQLTQSYDNIDRVQQQYRIGGFSSWERNSLMSMLTQLDKDITTQMRDDENSHYRNWNAKGNSWNNSWWKNPGATSILPGNRQDSNSHGSGRDGWGRGESGDHGNWNRDSSRRDWGRSESDRYGDLNRGELNGGESTRRDWSRGQSNSVDPTRRDWYRGDSNSGSFNRRDWNRGESNTAPGAGALPQNNPPSANNPLSSSGNTSRSTPAPSTGNTTPLSTGNAAPPTNNQSAGSNPPTGSGNPGAGSSAPGDGRRGGWSGERTGDGSGRTWGAGGSGGSGSGERRQ